MPAVSNSDGDAFVRELIGGDVQRHMMFAVISARRAANVKHMETCLEGVDVIWFVADGDGESYRAEARGEVIESGPLCASRNMALEVALQRGFDYCVQLSDDFVKARMLRVEPSDLANYLISDPQDWKPIKPVYVEKRKSDLRKGERTCNDAAAELKLDVSIKSAAEFAAALLDRSPSAMLAGANPTANLGWAVGSTPVGTDKFVVGDFMVVDAKSSPRFDSQLTLKEDYDFTAQHLAKYGCVLRCSKLCFEFKHYNNPGGAVDHRTSASLSENGENSIEQKNIARLHRKWPGCFRQGRNRNEVLLTWSKRKLPESGRVTPNNTLPPSSGDDDNKDKGERAPRASKKAKKEV